MSDVNVENLKANSPLSLKKNFSWTLFSNVIFSIMQLLILISLTKLGSQEMVGQYALALALTAPIYMLFNFQLRAIQATDKKEGIDFRVYFTFRLFSTSIAFIVIAITAYLLEYERITVIIILLIGLHKGIDSISDVIYGLQQKNERMDFISKSLILKGVLSLIFFFLFMLLYNSLVISVIGLIIGSSIVLIFYDMKNYLQLGASIKISIELPLFRKILKLGIPLGLAMMLISLNTNIPRYFIEQRLGLEELGFFAAIAYIILAGTMLINSLGQSITPRLASYYENNDFYSFKKTLIKLLLVGLGLGVLCLIFIVFFGEMFLSLVYTPEYAKYSNILLLLMIGGTLNFLTSFLGYAMTAARVFNLQPIIFLIAVIINTGLCIILIPKYSLVGASMAIIISSVAQLIALSLVIINLLKK